jgi:chemotaxis protein methyltransferase WspC
MSETVEAACASVEVELILRNEIGLDASTVGSSLIQRAAQRRMKKRGIVAIAAYAKLLVDEEQELRELIEQVVVPETYFFREPDAISDITRLALAAHATGDGAALRVLSVPCSTGEEPYSIAMSLLAEGMPASAIAIDAVDVSVEAVRRAKEGIYHGGSFRGDMSAWKKYFGETERGWELVDSVRALVHVTQGNLLSNGFQPPREQYDVIFCRNLLIYFDESAQARALAKLASLLAPDGVLVVGSADSFAARRAGFAPSSGHERSFLFRLQSTMPAVDIAPLVAGRVRPRALSSRALASRSVKRAVIRPLAIKPTTVFEKATQPAAVVSTGSSATTAMADVSRLGNEGRLEAAIAVGERAIRDGVVSVELLSLIGTMHAATPNLERAEACYRKALFLEPANEDALLHLALLLEQRGEVALAIKLRSRARRARSFHTIVTT